MAHVRTPSSTEKNKERNPQSVSKGALHEILKILKNRQVDDNSKKAKKSKQTRHRSNVQWNGVP